ncbi:MAG: hypothetical protein ACREOZ_00660 [Gloeomargaritales cyanobacterium]
MSDANEWVPATAKVVDFTGVKISSIPWNAKRVADGDYVGIVKQIFDRKSNNGDDQWVVVIALESRPNISYNYNCTLTPDGLWTLALLYQAAGKAVPQKKVKANPQTLINARVGLSLIVDDYQADKGRDMSKIDRVFAASDVADEPAEEDVEPASRSAAKTASRTTSKARTRRPEPADVDDSELEELDLEDL